MKVHLWKYTQFAQFNTTDTMLLVSGVHPGDNGTMGEIAVFSTRRKCTQQMILEKDLKISVALNEHVSEL